MAKKTFVAGAVLRAADVNEYLTDSRNYLINGGMDIWQRSTSSTAQGYCSADRWYMYNTAGTLTCSQAATSAVQGARYGLMLTQSGSASIIAAQQVIETANVSGIAGVAVTVSGYVAATASTTVSILVLYSTNVDNAVAGSWTSITATSGGSSVIPGTSVYTRMTGTYAIPSTAKSVMVRFVSSSVAAGQSWFLTGVQLEEGTVATPYHRATPTIQTELAACRRYYTRIVAGAIASYLAIGGSASTIANIYHFPLGVTMRIAPTAIDYSTPTTSYFFGLSFSGSGGSTITNLSINYTSPDVVGVTGAVTGATAGATAVLRAIIASAYIGFDAEL